MAGGGGAGGGGGGGGNGNGTGFGNAKVLTGVSVPNRQCTDQLLLLCTPSHSAEIRK